MAEYKVELDVYNGPLDLLLYLIRRSEVDIYDIPIAQITEQYVAYVSLLQNLDPDMAGDFLVMAATLMEIKSRTLLPKPPVEEEEEDFADPRLELVRQLLEYKKYKDAAHALDAAMQLQAMKFERVPVTPTLDSGELDLDEVQVWDLFAAFQKMLEATGKRNRKHEVMYDDTPIALHAADILDALERDGGRRVFQSLFEGRTKSQMIGLFLAMLELIRQKRVRAVQGASFAQIDLELLNAEPIFVDERKDYTSNLDEEDDEPIELPDREMIVAEGEELLDEVDAFPLPSAEAVELEHEDTKAPGHDEDN
ncbi:MAG TPA: segregation/condensation protein A [Phycisphaerae bacterium]|nr:segregation/condensation protein A [Phycisphaerae bacterium]